MQKAKNGNWLIEIRPEHETNVENKQGKPTREKRAENARNWRANNPERAKEHTDNWRVKNPNRLKYYSANNKARRKKRKIKLSPEHKRQMFEIYANCPEGHHVDHIIPMCGELVSGLHVPWNLQYLPILENLKKGNRVDLARPPVP